MTRNELALRFSGTGVELGVAGGAYTKVLLSNPALVSLYSVDRWSDHHSMHEYKYVLEKFKGNKKAQIIRSTFDEALELFGDNSLDFIYLDGYAHDYKDVLHNLDQWYQKLKAGGIFAGHDYADRWPAKKAVDEFTTAIKQEFSLTEGDTFASWYFMKPMATMRLTSAEQKDKSVVLVGNGPSVLAKAQGAIIDSFDEVVRFNCFKIKGFEPFTGTKTTLWSTFGRGQLPQDEARPSKVLFIHGSGGMPAYNPEELFRLPGEFFGECKKAIHEESKLADKTPLIPSSGFLVAKWFLDVLETPKIHLTGFDHFMKERSRMHHYWLNRTYGRPKEHDGDAEARILKQYQQQGRVIYL